MEFVKKHISKFVFSFACLFLAAAIAFSAYSFAGYVSRVDKIENAGVATIDCKVVVGGDLGSFINAPYIQTVGDNTSPIRMNDWSNASVTVKNEGTHGLKYNYSFVFYMPEDFAKCAMFQLLELESEGSEEVSKASRIYRISDDGNGLTEADRTDISDGAIEIENAYQQYIDNGNELAVAADSHVEVGNPEVTTIKRTYASYYLFGDSTNTKAFVCPVSFRETEELSYCRITVNIDSDDSAYTLNCGDAHAYVFRLVPRKALEGGVSETWSVDKYWITGDDGTQTCISEPIPESEDYEFRWVKEDGSTPVLQAHEINSADGGWFNVSVENNVGMTNPTRVSAVFTQSA